MEWLIGCTLVALIVQLHLFHRVYNYSNVDPRMINLPYFIGDGSLQKL